jgi:hypothetical protein
MIGKQLIRGFIPLVSLAVKNHTSSPAYVSVLLRSAVLRLRVGLCASYSGHNKHLTPWKKCIGGAKSRTVLGMAELTDLYEDGEPPEAFFRLHCHRATAMHLADYPYLGS